MLQLCCPCENWPGSIQPPIDVSLLSLEVDRVVLVLVGGDEQLARPPAGDIHRVTCRARGHEVVT